MTQNDFIGLNGYVWWIGVVEDRIDPLKLGRLRVRIAGWHSQDKNLLPTEKLPWAQVTLPTTGQRNFSTPKNGEIVSGYFIDGQSAQQPIVTGVMPGINLTLLKQPSGSPTVPAGQLGDRVDEPSTPATARGVVEYTPIQISNNQLAHVCDETLGIRIRAGFARLKNSEIVIAIRKAIKALIKLLNETDTSGVITWAINELKKIAAAIKYVTDIINEVLDFANLVKIIVRIIRAIVDYILALPAKLYRFVKECIGVVLSAIVAGISELFSGINSENLPTSDASIDDLFKETRNTLNSAKELVDKTVELVQSPIAILAAATAPASVAEQETAINSLLAITEGATNVEQIETQIITSVSTYLDNNSSTSEQVIADSSFNSGTVRV